LILGANEHAHSACFAEIDAVVSALTDRVVCFNAHHFPAPDGAIIYNLENVPGQIPDPRALWGDREIWDFDKTSAERYGATYVPIGYHPSMERFSRSEKLDIDIVFAGSINDRRSKILNALADRGLNVVVVPHLSYGAERDALLSRAKLALNMQFYPDGVWPRLRAAHLVANRVPMLSEWHRDCWPLVPSCSYTDLVDVAMAMLRGDGVGLADDALNEFRKMPMVLP